MDLKLIDHDARGWCVHDSDDEHIGSLRYEGAQQWVYARGHRNLPELNFSSATVDTAFEYVKSVEATAQPTAADDATTPSTDAPTAADNTNDRNRVVDKPATIGAMHAFFEHTLRGLEELSRQLGEPGPLHSECVLLLARTICMGKTPEQRQELRKNIVGLLDSSVTIISQRDSEIPDFLRAIVEDIENKFGGRAQIMRMTRVGDDDDGEGGDGSGSKGA